VVLKTKAPREFILINTMEARPQWVKKERERVQRVQRVVVKTKAPREVILIHTMEARPPRVQKERERVQRVQRVVVKTITTMLLVQTVALLVLQRVMLVVVR
jgi:hypothetical protein